MKTVFLITGKKNNPKQTNKQKPPLLPNTFDSSPLLPLSIFFATVNTFNLDLILLLGRCDNLIIQKIAFPLYLSGSNSWNSPTQCDLKWFVQLARPITHQNSVLFTHINDIIYNLLSWRIDT